MSISAISNATVASSEPPISPTRLQEDTAGREIISALDAGNLGAAQDAYNTLASYGSSAGPFTSAALNQQFQAVGQAIQSGDLATAQQTAKSLGQNLLKQDLNQAVQAYENGGWAGAKNAIENLGGDYWAVTGKIPTLPAPAASSANAEEAVSVNA